MEADGVSGCKALQVGNIIPDHLELCLQQGQRCAVCLLGLAFLTVVVVVFVPEAYMQVRRVLCDAAVQRVKSH